MSKKIAIGGDHAGFQLKEHLRHYLENQGHEVKDFGPYSTDAVDYADFVHPLAKAVTNKEVDFGILTCGSGMGVSISANRHKHVRASLVWMPELARLTRQHNDANVLCMAGRFIAPHLAELITEAFLETDFEGGRHQRRIDKIEAC